MIEQTGRPRVRGRDTKIAMWLVFGVLVAGLVAVPVAVAMGRTTWEDVWSTILGFLLFAVLTLLYFLPTIIAARKKHHNLGAIIAVNIIFGLSIIGWIIALVWSLTDPSPTVRVAPQAVYGQPPVYGQQPPPPVQYQVGDVVNGHRFNGQEWTPLQ